MDKIQLVDLKREYLSIKEEIDKATFEVIENGQFILGKNVESFEREFAEYCNVRYAIGVNSGTDALSLTLKALGINSGEVIVPSLTFVSSADCIVHNNAKPVFVDVYNDVYTLDVSKVERLINENTKAIIAVHLYGHPVDLDPLRELVDKYNIYLIEDAAQAHGARYKGRKVGGFGIAACFSFYPAKNLGAYGDGGMIITNDKDLAEKLKMLREYGQKEKYKHEFIGYNSRLDELQASILRVKLKHLDEWNEKRRKNADIYKELLKNLEDYICLPVEKEYATHIYHLYVIRCKRREELRRWLDSKGVSTGIHYPIPIHKQIAYNAITNNVELPITESVTEEILSLPMFPQITYNELEYIANSIKEFVNGN